MPRIHNVSLFPKLHLEQSVCKLSVVVFPPFDQGIIWSTCNSTDESLAGDAPQAQHLKFSFFKTGYLNLLEIVPEE
jgi:hypothetical protein